MTTAQETGEPYSAVLAAVERALGMLGESGKMATLWYISRAGLRRDEIPNRPNKFMSLLTEIFGAGATVIEREILKNIRLTEPLSPGTSTFPGAVSELRDEGRLNRDAGCQIAQWPSARA